MCPIVLPIRTDNISIHRKYRNRPVPFLHLSPKLLLILSFQIIHISYVSIDVKQYGGKKKTGTEHMIVALMDRVLTLLDSNNTKSAVLMAAADWAAAFDRGDPTKTTQKLITLKLRSSVVPLIISYMSGRTMSLKFNQDESGLYKLCGASHRAAKLARIAS